MRIGLNPFIGIDLGTSHTLISDQDQQIRLNEPSVVAVREQTGEMIAYGTEAEEMIGRAPENMTVVSPIHDGVIGHFDLTVSMLRHFLKQFSGGKKLLFRPQIAITVPCGISSVKRRAAEDAAIQAGAQKVIILEAPLASAIGSGLDVYEPVGHMVVDIGGGTTQTAILSLGGIVESHYINKGGKSIDKLIIEYMKRTYNMLIGPATAEEVKKTIGTASHSAPPETFDVPGMDLVSGMPKKRTIDSGEIRPILDDFVDHLVHSVRTTIEKAPPELAGDVMEHGIVLCGGGANLKGLAEKLSEEISIPINLAGKPEYCAALGVGAVLKNMDRPSIWKIGSRMLASNRK